MGPVEFGAQDFWKIVINEHFGLSSSVAEVFCYRVKDSDIIMSYLTQILAVGNLFITHTAW